MSLENNNNSQRNFEQQRRMKAESFHLNIQDNYDDDGSFSYDEPEELNSYSGQDVKEQIARESKNALKKRKKAEKKELKLKNKRNRRVFRWMWVISVVIVGAMLSVYIITGMNDLLAINRQDSSTIMVEIPENPTLDEVAQTLEKNGVIDEISYFKMFAMLTKSDEGFTQGTYEMRKNMDYEAIINYLMSSGNRTDTVSVMITEGENVLEVAQTLKENGVLSETDKFLELCSSDNFDEDFSFLKDIKNGSDRYYKLEGYLYPDTYEFYKNEDAEKVIYKFLNNYEMKITEKQDVRGYDKLTTVKKMVEESNSGYTLDEVMIIASIIQAEAANTDDMYNVSSILHNRLEASADLGVSNLGLDSTKFYPYRNADNAPDNFVSKYDTYDEAGLPEGPICNPGMEAIKAALNPNSTSYYYFCHDSEGNAYYASTIYEHNANLEYIE
ncbi:MAG: endolytic transglycosylase MltG [Ruminococcus sp.]|nr:endolytic transglycosylase MltG [Ruminococcus sp.]